MNLRNGIIALALVAVLAACTGSTTAPRATANTPAEPAVPAPAGEPAPAAGRTVTGAETIDDQVDGNLTVVDGGNLTLNGQVTGDLVVEQGGRVELLGMVLGDLVNAGDVTVSGWVEGRVIDQGGNTELVSGAVVEGSFVP